MVAEIAQLNAKREEMIRKEVEKIQNESKMMMERYLEECKRRTEMISKTTVQSACYATRTNYCLS